MVYMLACFCQAQFLLAVPVQVQLGTEISLMITVTPTHSWLVVEGSYWFWLLSSVVELNFTLSVHIELN